MLLTQEYLGMTPETVFTSSFWPRVATRPLDRLMLVNNLGTKGLFCKPTVICWQVAFRHGWIWPPSLEPRHGEGSESGRAGGVLPESLGQGHSDGLWLSKPKRKLLKWGIMYLSRYKITLGAGPGKTAHVGRKIDRRTPAEGTRARGRTLTAPCGALAGVSRRVASLGIHKRWVEARQPGCHVRSSRAIREGQGRPGCPCTTSSAQ